MKNLNDNNNNINKIWTKLKPTKYQLLFTLINVNTKASLQKNEV